MDVKVTIIAIITFIGTYYVGYHLTYCLIAFNAVFWLGLAYDMVGADEDEILAELLSESASNSPDPAQIELERRLLKQYLERLSIENNTPIDGM